MPRSYDYLRPKTIKGKFLQRASKIHCRNLKPLYGKTGQNRKKDIYEKAGVSEYWIVSPQGSMEIYYLRDGNYMLEQSYMLQNEPDEEEYNAETEICLREFPHITMTLGDIFSGLE